MIRLTGTWEKADVSTQFCLHVENLRLSTATFPLAISTPVRDDLYGTIFLSVHIRRRNIGQVQTRANMMDLKRPLVTLSKRNDPVCAGRSMKDANFSRVVMVLIIEMSLDQSYHT